MNPFLRGVRAGEHRPHPTFAFALEEGWTSVNARAATAAG